VGVFRVQSSADLPQPANPPPAVRFASFQSYTPTHVAEKILSSRAVLEAEHKQVTVLFADIKGLLEPLTDRHLEEVRKTSGASLSTPC